MVRQRGLAHSIASGSSNGELVERHWPRLLQLERRLLMPLYRVADSGVLGLTPLRTHILICGFPRSGTTLLQLMLENALPEARRFGREIAGWRGATYAWRNHAVVISKMPHDIFRLEPLRNFYSARSARLRILLMLRDPRDVLTSQRRFGGPQGYCVSTERWRNYHRAFVDQRGRDDCLVVRYEDLVADPDQEQRKIQQFTGEPMRLPFSGFLSVRRPDFQTETLNGLRPVETDLVRRWAAPEHRPRIAQVLEELPELPQAAVELGYETSTEWARQWDLDIAREPAEESSGHRLTTR